MKVSKIVRTMEHSMDGPKYSDCHGKMTKIALSGAACSSKICPKNSPGKLKIAPYKQVDIQVTLSEYVVTGPLPCLPVSSLFAKSLLFRRVTLHHKRMHSPLSRMEGVPCGRRPRPHAVLHRRQQHDGGAEDAHQCDA